MRQSVASAKNLAIPVILQAYVFIGFVDFAYVMHIVAYTLLYHLGSTGGLERQTRLTPIAGTAGESEARK